MTEKELAKLYRMACSGKGFEPNDGQFQVWKKTLIGFTEKDMSQALVWWFESSTNFPMPADLKPLAEKSRRLEHAQSARKTVLTRWICPDCNVSCAGYIEPEDYSPRRCQGIPRNGSTAKNAQGKDICGALLTEVYRDLTHKPQLVGKAG